MKRRVRTIPIIVGLIAILSAGCASTGPSLPPPPPGRRPEPTAFERVVAAGREQPGRIDYLPDFPMPQLETVRDIWIYTPFGYDDSEAAYPVLYMHDGQNLFYPDLSFAGEWMVDEIMDGLVASGLFGGAIVVGIANGGNDRVREYAPYPTDFNGGESRADQYLKFIVDELKPWVDENYRTIEDRTGTAMAGSSLGGLISLYAFREYPEVFSTIIAMSPSLWVEDGLFLRETIAAEYPGGLPMKIYLDMGTAEGSENVEFVERLSDIYTQAGAGPVLSVIEPGAGHNERAWRQRLPRALGFAFGFLIEGTAMYGSSGTQTITRE
jgi:predicted alpha/beta superfamily hydrolase